MSFVRNKNNRGFLMLEVMLSVLIIGSGVVFVIQSYSTSLRGTDISLALIKGCFFLEDKLFELDYKGFRGGISDASASDIVEGEPYYRWVVQSSPLEDKTNIKISRVDLNVYYKKGSQEKVLSIETFLKLKEG